MPAPPRGAANPHAKGPCPCRHCHLSARCVVDVPVLRLPLDAACPSFSGRRIPRTVYSCCSCFFFYPEGKRTYERKNVSGFGRKEKARTTMCVSIKFDTVLKTPSAPLGCFSHLCRRRINSQISHVAICFPIGAQVQILLVSSLSISPHKRHLTTTGRGFRIQYYSSRVKRCHWSHVGLLHPGIRFLCS